MIKETVDYMTYSLGWNQNLRPGEKPSVLIETALHSIVRFVGLAATVFVVVYAATSAFRLASG